MSFHWRILGTVLFHYQRVLSVRQIFPSTNSQTAFSGKYRIIFYWKLGNKSETAVRALPNVVFMIPHPVYREKSDFFTCFFISPPKAFSLFQGPRLLAVTVYNGKSASIGDRDEYQMGLWDCNANQFVSYFCFSFWLRCTEASKLRFGLLELTEGGIVISRSFIQAHLYSY